MEKEIWRDVEGYEGAYKISNLGRVRSLDRWVYKTDGSKAWTKGRVLKQSLRNKYLRVILAKPAHKSNHQSVHRLVAKAFIPNPNNKEYVNHIDGNKLNNHISNLEWLTPFENSRDARDKGYYRTGTRHPDSKITPKEIEEILKLYYLKGLYQERIADFCDVSQTSISSIIRGDSWHFREYPYLIGKLHNLKEKKNIVKINIVLSFGKKETEDV